MKIKITQKDYNYMLSEIITKLMVSGKFSLFETTQVIDSKDINDIKKDISAKINAMIANKNPEIYAVAKNLGINLDYNTNDARKVRGSLQSRTDGSITQQLVDDVKQYSLLLRNYMGSNGYLNFEKLKLDHPEDYDEILRMRDFIDQIGMAHLYDKNFIKDKAKRYRLNGRYGVTIDDQNNVNMDNLDFNPVSDKEIEDYIKNASNKDLSDFDVIYHKRLTIINKYMSSKYGLEVKMPKQVFSAGNSKLPEDTLIINFTSAQRCPAWNDCLVRHACYARAIEHMRQNVRDTNTQRNLMWEAGHQDPELLQMLLNLIKAYVIDYAGVVQELKISKIKGLGRLSSKMLREANLETLPDAVIEIIKKHKRINDLRLNENGDFIGQWLVDEFDRFAGELKRIEVSTACYTCRNLNFNGIKNIIINASKNLSSGSTVARYFLAVKEKTYKAFDETYGGPDNSLIFEVDENGEKTVRVNPQPLYNARTGQPTGEFYYKCPCNRLEGGGMGEDEETLSEAKTNGNKINCYQCRTCYLPNEFNKPYYVLVSVHGSGKNDFIGQADIPTFGVSKNFLRNMEVYNKQQEVKNQRRNPKQLTENTMSNMANSQTLAFGKITENAVNSVRERLANI